jgi:hypothetical protein
MDKKLLASAALASLLLYGCAATQVGESTLQMTETVGRIRQVQVLRNIAGAIVNPSAIPNQIVLGTGQANVSTGITGTAKATSINKPGTLLEVDLSPTDTWTAQWQFTVVNDPDDLRRLRNIYALVTATDNQYDLMIEYYVQHPASQSASTCMSTSDQPTGTADQTPPPSPASPPSATAERQRQAQNRLFSDLFLLPGAPGKPANEAPLAQGQSTPAPSHLVVSCDEARSTLVKGDSIDCRIYQAQFAPPISPSGPRGLPFKRWLFWRSAGASWQPKQPDRDVTPLGTYGPYELGVTSLACFDDFVALVQGLTPNANSTSGKGPSYMLQ